MSFSQSRRNFLKYAATSLLGTALALNKQDGQSAGQVAYTGRRVYEGSDLSGWNVVLGDGIYTAPGEAPVTTSDIATTHYESYSQLLANVAQRSIMAHNITVNRFVDVQAFDFVHTAGYSFRLPYMPSTSNKDLNAQTLEGGLFIWDGTETRRDYGLAFQWMLNPWGGDDFEFGDLRCWTDVDGGMWQKVGFLQPDLAWHEVQMIFDFRRQTTALLIDDRHYASRFAATEKPDHWSTQIEPGVQAEIISLWPGEGDGALHKADFRDWYWIWEPYGQCSLFLPMVAH